MKHYAENLGSNVAAMIKVRQVDHPHIVKLCLAYTLQLREVRGNITFRLGQVSDFGEVYDSFCSFQYIIYLFLLSPRWYASPFQGHTQALNSLMPNGF